MARNCCSRKHYPRNEGSTSRKDFKRELNVTKIGVAQERGSYNKPIQLCATLQGTDKTETLSAEDNALDKELERESGSDEENMMIGECGHCLKKIKLWLITTKDSDDELTTRINKHGNPEQISGGESEDESPIVSEMTEGEYVTMQIVTGATTAVALDNLMIDRYESNRSRREEEYQKGGNGSKGTLLFLQDIYSLTVDQLLVI
jgi:hypothetical protein